MDILNRNWARILLVVSLAVNLFVLGAFGSHWLSLNTFGIGQEDRSARMAGERSSRGGRRVHPGMIVGLPSPGQLMNILSEREREDFKAAWRAENPRLRGQFRAMYDARADVAATLSEDAYQRQDLLDAFAALRARQMELAASSQELIVNLADQLDDEGRDRLAEIMRPPAGRPWESLKRPPQNR